MICLAAIASSILTLFCGNWIDPGSDVLTSLYQTGNSSSSLDDLRSYSTLSNLPHAAVASDHHVCSQLGSKILQGHENATAMDAAVTVALCLGVANPASSGVGGGGFILVHHELNGNNILPPFRDARTRSTTPNSDGKVTEVVDAREQAPSGATQEMFLNNTVAGSSVRGGLSVAIPGELRGLELAHARYGKLSWQEVVQPVLKLAQEGVPVNANLAKEIEAAAQEHMKPEFGLRALVTHDDSWERPLQEGEVFKNKQLAATLEAIMNEGPDAIYIGSRASQLASEVQAAGGIITADDLASYHPTLRSPLVARNVNGYTLVGVPPPSSGGATVLGVARFLAGLSVPLTSWAADTAMMHWWIEACQHAFAIRMSLCDPDYHTQTVNEAVHDLVSSNSSYMAKMRQLSREDGSLRLSQYGGEKWSQLQDSDGVGASEDAHEGDRNLYRRFGYLEDAGTSHFSIVDKEGNAASIQCLAVK